MMANRTAERVALLGIALAAAGLAIAGSVEYRWTSGPDMGGQITATIVNAAGSAFRIYCATGREVPRGGFEYETKAFDYETKAQPLTPDAIQRQQQRRAVQQQIPGGLSPKEWDKLEAETDKFTRGQDGKRVRIVVGKKSFVLISGPSMEGPSMEARSSRIKLSQLVNEMIKTRAKFFLVEVPRTKIAERFSLKDAATHLKNEFGHGESIYESCV